MNKFFSVFYVMILCFSFLFSEEMTESEKLMHEIEEMQLSPKQPSFYEKSCSSSFISPLENGNMYAEGDWLYWKTTANIPYNDQI